MSDGPGHVEVPQSWTQLLADQLEFHWSTLLRPKLEGLTDDEFHWEPVAGCWGVRRRAESTAPIAAGSGAAVLEFAIPEPDPPPVTTIAWRLAHLTIGCFGQRTASHFGGSPIDYQTHDHPTGAAEALAEFDAAYEHWIEHVKSLDESALREPVGRGSVRCVADGWPGASHTSRSDSPRSRDPASTPALRSKSHRPLTAAPDPCAQMTAV